MPRRIFCSSDLELDSKTLVNEFNLKIRPNQCTKNKLRSRLSKLEHYKQTHTETDENFNRLSRVHECTNVTDDRQTDRRQTDGRRHIANMNMSSRSLKMTSTSTHA